MPVSPETIHGFWFGPLESPTDFPKDKSKNWFMKDEKFDASIRNQFESTWEEAQTGVLETWLVEPASLMAYIILNDQFPRNMFRDTGKAFASDGRALAAAELAVTKGMDKQLLPIERIFLYLPYEHAEDLAAQERPLP